MWHVLRGEKVKHIYCFLIFQSKVNSTSLLQLKAFYLYPTLQPSLAVKEQAQGAYTCPVETMTGSFINSSDIGQRKSTGITGALEFLSLDTCPLQLGGLPFSPAEASMSGFSVCTKSLIFFSSIDIFSMLSPGSPPLASTISCKASDSCVRSTIPINCNLSANLLRTAGSVAASLLLL